MQTPNAAGSDDAQRGVETEGAPQAVETPARPEATPTPPDPAARPGGQRAEAGPMQPTGADEAPSGDWPTRGVQWNRVSPKYAIADLVMNLLLDGIVLVVLCVLLVVRDETPVLLVIGLVALAVLLLVNAVFAFRRVKAIGYILREDDLLFRRGILFERVIAVPYGRLQLVDVTRGPLLRALGLATLKFVTASAATGVNLPGLRFDEAEELRDRLVQLAETRRSGL